MLFSVNEIRAEFIKYFVENWHTHVKSSSFVPDNDPTLMFTDAGMVQFKDTFTGKKVLPYKRATTTQKFLRAGEKTFVAISGYRQNAQCSKNRIA